MNFTDSAIARLYHDDQGYIFISLSLWLALLVCMHVLSLAFPNDLVLLFAPSLQSHLILVFLIKNRLRRNYMLKGLSWPSL